MAETLINKELKNDFERLLFAQKYISLLKSEIEAFKDQVRLEKIEKGKLQSEVEELKYLNEQYFQDIKPADYKKKAELVQIENNKLEKRIHILRDKNKNLVHELVQLKIKQNK